METINPTSNSQGLEKILTVQNKMGIHARPAAMIVRTSNQFKSEIFFMKDDELVNGKSIMGLMMLAAGSGSKIKMTATGDDASEAIKAVEELFIRRFDEK